MTSRNSIPKPKQDLSAEADLKRQILADIVTHVQVYGRTAWSLIRENPNYAHVIGKAAGASGDRKFFRWVNSVCEVPPPDKTRPHEARDAANDAMDEAKKRARLAVQRNLPAVPSPAYMLRAGPRAEKNIDLLASVHLLWEDVERLRAHALAPDEHSPDGWGIKDPKLFDASIKRGLDALKAILAVKQDIYDLQYFETFFDEIVDIIVTELASHRELQERVMRRLKAFNDRAGVTV